MFSDGESGSGPRKVGDGSPQVWAEFRGRLRGPGGGFRGLGEISVPTAEAFRGAEGDFRGPGQFRQVIADPFQLNEDPLPISGQR
jgi:hypothetical protein